MSGCRGKSYAHAHAIWCARLVLLQVKTRVPKLQQWPAQERSHKVNLPVPPLGARLCVHGCMDVDEQKQLSTVAQQLVSLMRVSCDACELPYAGSSGRKWLPLTAEYSHHKRGVA